MRRLGVLSNANSGGNHHGLGSLSAAAQAVGAPHHVTHSIEEIEPALRQIAASGADLLAINGGDGTLQSVLSVLRRVPIFGPEPILVLLGGGTTNMVQRDVGVPGPPDKSLRRLAHACRYGGSGQIVTRTVIELSCPDRTEPRYGFFFGTAALPRLIRATRATLHPRGLTGPAGEGVALAWTLGRLLTGRLARDTLLHPDEIAYALDGCDWQEKRFIVFMVTTLDRLVLGMRPVAANGHLGFVGLPWPYRRLWRALPRLLTGRRIDPSRDPLMRATAGEIALRATSSFVLDGELSSAEDGRPIALRAAAPARFLRL